MAAAINERTNLAGVQDASASGLAAMQEAEAMQPHAFMRLVGISGLQNAYTVRYEALSAWRRRGVRGRVGNCAEQGVDLYLLNGEVATLGAISFQTVTEVMKRHYGKAFGTLFAAAAISGQNLGVAEVDAIAFLRVDHVLAFGRSDSLGYRASLIGKQVLPELPNLQNLAEMAGYTQNTEPR